MKWANAIRKKRWKKVTIITAAVLLIIAAILYQLAYRYLIDRVEATARDSTPSTITEQPSGTVEYDDWNYKSDSVQISIDEIVKGTGADKITYFVADVRLGDSSMVYSAFAENKVGRNIVETTSKIARDHDAVLAINGDYYGFRGDGILIRNGTLYRNNPARTAAAFFRDGSMKIFDEKGSSAEQLLAEGVTNTFSFGPVLVRDGTLLTNFGHMEVDTNFGNHSIQGSHPRTGIGMIEPGHYVFVVVDGRMENYSRGMTLAEFAQVFADLGAVEAYNLDGGGSSTMYFMGRVVNNPLGKGQERRISDIIYVR
ncbi:Exopolysaccharide biosynthesis protein [Paenibacillus sophorae]|uniref:Exopolysaccharide biosynthesis protein n=1 Tax=Paenibacillus sophorae TaxID=1333845 RepID=A0A1H8MNV0_9BACL|nr:phosphodiester glycosidase family protein [Paenibacillus sophorae]SEO19102.1 Exopolysaccharide biosynthesis protein [Paenibacillus sophorae]